jgi:hypothetical protein
LIYRKRVSSNVALLSTFHHILHFPLYRVSIISLANLLLARILGP